MPKVKAVMAPLAGQSFNPSATAHKGVLNKVFIEEKSEIEKAKALSLKNQNKPTVVDEEVDQVESSSEEDILDSEGSVIVFNKAPDRLKKKTKKDLKRKVSWFN